jgi:tetratricopeptide (TPR) repeat protein
VELYSEERKYDDAISVCARVLEIQENNLGTDSPKLVSALWQYASVLQQVGRTEDAAAMRTRAEEIRLRSIGRPPN